MSSNQPENYQFHRTQTPESPRPIYPPEPSNIPVLRMQNDTAFTDSSTYDIRPSSQLHAIEGGSDEQAGLNQGASMTETAHNGSLASPGILQNPAVGGSNETQQVESYEPQRGADQIDSQVAYPNFMPNMHSTAFPQSDFQLSQTLETLAKSQTNPSEPKSHDEVSQETPAHIKANQETPVAGLGDAPTSNLEVAQHGVNYQSLLDTLARSASTAPPNDQIPAHANAIQFHNDVLTPSGTDRQLPSAPGLPPRPPIQESTAVPPNFPQNENVHAYYQSNAPNAFAQQYQPSSLNPTFNSTSSHVALPGASSGAFHGSNGLPPPPMASFQNSTAILSNPQISQEGLRGGGAAQAYSDQDAMGGSDDGDHKWGPDVQNKYDQFLTDERAYVTEGVWDRFPLGSRMFVGNLPTEKITKRDLFHIFHKHGKLAQISIKQAYGFVQFLEATDCHRALEMEQGVSIRGRRLHLEVSKPQKNTRNAGAPDNNNRHAGRKRSRSPERRGGRRGGGDTRAQFPDQRTEPPRRRDDHKSVRSPSPRAFGGRDEYRSRDAYYRGHDRPRSPYGRPDGHYRSPSPRGGFDNEADLPIPRRHPNDVPDVQVIVLDEVDTNFIGYLENGLRIRGLQCQTLMLGSRLPLAAVVKRQIIEGVQAVIKLTRTSQYNSRVPLQVFDRSGGSEVRFNEYVDLDIPVAAEVVLQNKRNQRPYSTHPYPRQASHGSQPPQPYPQAGMTPDPNIAGLIQTLDGPALQQFLANMQQQSSQTRPGSVMSPPPMPPMPGGSMPPGNQDLASLLTNVARQQGQQQQYANPAAPSYPPPTPQGYPSGGQGPQNMENIMHQLSQFRR